MATTTKKYKLIKEYPGSLKLNTVIEIGDETITIGNVQYLITSSFLKSGIPRTIWEAENYSEFWEELKEKLFTTYDGVPIYEGDTYYFVSKYFDLYVTENALSRNLSESSKYFSTEEAAKKYIYENKPRYSKRDLECILRRSDNYNTTCDDKLMACKLMIIATRDLIKEMLKEE